MTESPEHQGIECSSKGRMPLSLYREQRREVTRSKLRDYLSSIDGLSLLTPYEEVMSGKNKYQFVCSGCGTKFLARPVDVLRSCQNSCNSCSRKRVMKRIMGTDAGAEHHKRITAKAAIVNSKDRKFVALRKRCNAVKARCTNPNDARFKYYGGRGILFLFDSPLAMAEWVRDNLGFPDACNASLDRIDNEGHYAPGNLRWATPKIQGANKRQYVVGDYGERVRRLREARPDYSEQTIRTLVKDGLTDEQIISRRKWDGCGRYIRHT